MWRLCRLGYQHEPGLMLVAFVLSLLSALPDALIAVWLKWLGDGVLGHQSGLVLAASIGLAVSATATWFLRTVSTRVTRRFRDKVTIALESHIARLLASIATVAHHERPDYLDRLSTLRDHVFVLDHMYMSVFSTAGWILRLAVTITLLGSIHPALTLLGADLTPVADTIVRNVPCAVPNVCGASCQAFTRSLPFNGTYYIEVTGAAPATTCTGGLYRLLVTSPNGTVPTLAQDDITP